MPGVGEVDKGIKQPRFLPREAWRKALTRALLFGGVPLFLLLFGLDAGIRLQPAHKPAGSTSQSQQAPDADQGAEAYAARFATDYLTFDPAQPVQYEQRVRGYLADGVAPSLWNGKGRQTALEALPAGTERHDQVTEVTVAVLVDSGRWLYLGVPVAHASGGYSVAGEPAFLPPPSHTSWAPSEPAADQDVSLTQQLQSSTSAFFQAYGSSDNSQLSFDAAPGANLTGLHGAVDLLRLESLTVYQGPPTQRTARAVVQWQDSSGAGYRQAYTLQLQQVAGKWLIASLAPAIGGGTA